eukprot:CAMPEP_0119035154 /NCGR_PEP_ID=MMETSP1177-20130426/2111_1 /TAXON_ID=2985 /ORGANISM="Ochromonas sp, Strain CCMP1899" /LENGTH=383 /DNA_ID=CAMNT_0006993099 /DNA_START=156 /DNA_END=1307 /DNA_ORIENTATION=-
MGSKPSSNEELTKLSLSEELTKPPPNVEATSTKPNSSDGQLSDDFSEMDLAPTRRRATSMELLQVLQMQQGTVYDGIVCDMDGVLWLGADEIDKSIDALKVLQETGKRVVFVTNNSARTRQKVVDKLANLGYDTGVENVITSSSVTAEYLFEQLNKGNLTHDGERVDETPIKVFMVGNPALQEELELKGFKVLLIADDEPVGLDEKAFHEQQESLDKDVKAVVVGIDYSFTYRKLAIGGLYIQTGCLYIATNPDNANRIPGGGMYPEPGVLIAAFKSVCGKDPIICGKPSHIIVEHVLKHLKNPDPSKVLMIGDRLDTDIAFANKAEFASCLVLSGVTSPDEAQDQIEDLLNLSHTPQFVEESLWELVSRLHPTMRKSEKNVE